MTRVQCDDTVEKYMTINNPTKGNAPYRGGREKSMGYLLHTYIANKTFYISINYSNLSSFNFDL